MRVGRSNLRVQIKTTRKSLRVTKKVSFEPCDFQSKVTFSFFEIHDTCTCALQKNQVYFHLQIAKHYCSMFKFTKKVKKIKMCL